ETPQQARSHPEQRQVHVLLLFVATSDYRGCFAGELCVLSTVRRFPRRIAAATRPRSPLVIRQHALSVSNCMLTYHKRRSWWSCATTILESSVLDYKQRSWDGDSR